MAYSVVGAFRDCRRDRRGPAPDADRGVPRQPGPVRSPSPSTGHADPSVDQPARGSTANELNTRVPVDLTDSEPIGVLVVGVNPYRPLNPEYRAFLTVVARQVRVALGDTVAYQVERLRSSVLADLDRAKMEFFQNVSHELRTPLTVLLAPLQNLLAAPTAAR